MDPELEIMRLLEDGPASLRSLLSRLPRSTVYRAARALRGRGLVARAGRGRWTLTPAGLAWLRSQRAGVSPVAPPVTGATAAPTLPVPALDLMPTEVHRAVARLALLAARARRRHPRHHLSFVLMGPPLRGKTWLMLVLARLLGADPATSILHAGVQTAGGLGARRNSAGEVAAVRDALRSPLLAIDEWQRGSTAVRRATAALLHGERTLALENDAALDVAAVVVLGLNPAAQGSLEERLGLDAALIRRAVVVDFADVELPADFAEQGEELLDTITAMGAAALPEPGPDDEDRALREGARAALLATLDGPERVATLDVHAVAQLAAEATGVLAAHDALRMVLTDLLTLWATLGWVRADWRSRLDLPPLPPTSDTGPLAPAAAGVAPPPQPPAAADEPHAWEARMARVDALLAERGVAEPDDLAPALDLAAALEEHAVTLPVAAVPWLGRVLRVVAGPGEENESEARLAALEALDRTGADPAGAAHLAATARRLGWRTRDAAEVLQVVATGEAALGLTAEGLEALAAELARLGCEPAEAAARIADMVRWHGSARAAIQRAEARLAAVKDSVERAEARENAARTRVRALEGVLKRAAEDPQVAPWLSVSDARLAARAYEGKVRIEPKG